LIIDKPRIFSKKQIPSDLRGDSREKCTGDDEGERLADAITASAADGGIKPVDGIRGDGDVEANADGEQNQNTPHGPAGAAEDAINSKQVEQAENQDEIPAKVVELVDAVSGDSIAGSGAPSRARVVVEGAKKPLYFELGFLGCHTDCDPCSAMA